MNSTPAFSSAVTKACPVSGLPPMGLSLSIASIQQSFIPLPWAMLAVPVLVLVLWWLIRKHAPGTQAMTAAVEATLADRNDQPRVAWKSGKITLREGARWVEQMQNEMYGKHEIRLISIVSPDVVTLDIRADLGRYVAGVEVERGKGDSKTVFAVPTSDYFDTDRVVLSAAIRNDFFRVFSVALLWQIGNFGAFYGIPESIFQ
jgi:hypothetical protein